MRELVAVTEYEEAQIKVMQSQTELRNSIVALVEWVGRYAAAVNADLRAVTAERDDYREKFELLQGRINIPVGREPVPWESNPDYQPGGN